MQIGGLQKLSLLDYPDRICATVFTLGCNYRCPFCHNAALIQAAPSGAVLAPEEVLGFLQTRLGRLNGVCITGGEPLLQADLEAFLREIKRLGFAVKLDTNGSRPEKLRLLLQAGLVDYVAMDVKNTAAKYAQTVGIPDFDIAPVKESISLLRSGAVPYEFRTTVVRELHSREDMLSIARWLQGAARYFLQCYVDSPDVLLRGLSGYSKEEMEELLALLRPILPSAALRGI